MRTKNIVGPRIREARRKLKITQMSLAAKLQLLGVKIDRSSIAKLESGKRPVTDIEIAAISKVLGTDIPWLFEGSDHLVDQLDVD